MMVRYKVYCMLDVTSEGKTTSELHQCRKLPVDADQAGDAVEMVRKEMKENYDALGVANELNGDELLVDFGDMQYRFYDFDVKLIPDNKFLKKWRELNKKSKEMLSNMK